MSDKPPPAPEESNTKGGNSEYPDPRYSHSTGAGYASAEFGLTAMEFMIQVYLLEYYVRVMGAPPWLAGAVIVLATLWDAVSDPLMGAISDRTKSRWGRRIPYMAVALPLLALSFMALFTPPGLSGDWSIAAYMLAMTIAVNTAMTLFSAPHLALITELSHDGEIRTGIFGWRLAFANFGMLIGVSLPALIGAPNATSSAGASEDVISSTNGIRSALEMGGAELDSRMIASWVAAAILLITGYITIRTSRRFDKEEPDHSALSFRSVFNSLKALWEEPLFRILLAAFAVAAIGRAVNASVALFYYSDRLAITEQQTGLILIVFLISMIVSIPGWLWLARRFGKKRPALAGVSFLGIMTVFGYPLFPAGEVFWPMCAAVAGGFAAGAIVLLESLTADLVELDQRRHKVSREGIFYGIWKLINKCARAVGVGIAGLSLQIIGYQEEASSQSADTVYGLGIIFGPVVGIFFITAALVFARFNMQRLR